MKTLTEKYNAILEDRFTKQQFLRDVRLSHPNLITQYNSFDDCVIILKNKGLIYETSENLPKYKEEKLPKYEIERNPLDKFSAESIERGLDVELENMGYDSANIPADYDFQEEYDKALSKTLKNLEKDVNFYLNQLAKIKTPSKRTDILTPTTPSNTVDKVNKMTKVKDFSFAKNILKESIKEIIVNILKEDKKGSLNEGKRFTYTGQIV